MWFYALQNPPTRVTVQESGLIIPAVKRPLRRHVDGDKSQTTLPEHHIQLRYSNAMVPPFGEAFVAVGA